MKMLLEKKNLKLGPSLYYYFISIGSMEMRHQLVFLMIACAIKYMYVSAQRIPPIKKGNVLYS